MSLHKKSQSKNLFYLSISELVSIVTSFFPRLIVRWKEIKL